MPASNTYEAIQSYTLTNTSPSITFGSIPQTYTDLVIVSSVRISGTGGEGCGIRFNSDTGSNYSYTRLYASSAVYSDRGTNLTSGEFGYFPGDDSTAGLFGNGVGHIMNYSNTTTHKTHLLRWNNNQNVGTTHTGLNVGLWRNTSAITSITLTAGSSKNFISGCTFSLYGIKAA
jgi:hypothetical protein